MGKSRTLVILAGGQSRRMGRDKAGLPVGHGTLLSHIVARLSPVVDEVVVAGGAEPGLGVRWVADEVSDRGPLGGMLSGLRASRNPWAWIVACDLPDVAPPLADLLFAAPGTSEAVVPRIGGQVEGTCAVYSTALVTRIRELLEAGSASVASLVRQSNTRYIEEEALRTVDPQLRSFRNLNTRKDYERWLKSRESPES